MKQVWKFYLQITDSFEIQMPSGARILKVAWQSGFACLWAEVYTDNEPESRTFYCHGTGHRVETDGRQWIGTLVSDLLVWHFYEAPKR